MQEPFEIDFKELFEAIKRRWYMVVLLCVGCACGLTYFLGSGIKTYYEVKTRIIVGNASSGDNVSYNIQEIELYQSYMNTYVAMLKTDDVIDQTVEALSFYASSEKIKECLQVTPQASTQFFEIKLDWENKEQSVEILTILTDTFIKEMSMIYPDISLHIMDKVDVPKLIEYGNPKQYVFMLGAVIGCVLSLLVIFSIEFLDNTIKGENEIERRMKSYQLAVIPKVKKNELTVSLSEGKMPATYFLEAYRRLRTSLSFLSINKNIKVIAVTSQKIGEGKSISSAMLALCMALSGKKTLLIDGNIRKPNLHKFFNLGVNEGLVDVLQRKTTPDKVIQVDVVLNLDFLSAGSVLIHSSELLCNEQLKRWIKVFKEHYDYIIVDTPSIGFAADAEILAQYVDGTILMATHRKTKFKDLERAKEQIEHVGGDVLGVVINKKKMGRRNIDHYKLNRRGRKML